MRPSDLGLGLTHPVQFAILYEFYVWVAYCLRSIKLYDLAMIKTANPPAFLHHILISKNK